MPAHFDAQADLVSYLNQLGPQCRPAELLDVVRRTRLLLESTGFKKSYPTLSLYCDWYMHNPLDRHELIWHILAEINTICCDTSSPGPAEAIAGRLRLEVLRSEAIALFNSQMISPFLFVDDSNRANFAGALLGDLSGKPIRWPAPLPKRAKAVFDQMMQGPTLGRGAYPHELFVDHRTDGHEGAGFYWTITIYENKIAQAQITGQLAKTGAANGPILLAART